MSRRSRWCLVVLSVLGTLAGLHKRSVEEAKLDSKVGR